MALRWTAGDELPHFVATIEINGSTTTDLSSGWTFALTLRQGSATPVLTKSTNITGAAGSKVTVAWSDNDLNVPAGTYSARLVATRTSDSAEFTVHETFKILEA